MSIVAQNFGKHIWFDGKILEFCDAKVGDFEKGRTACKLA